MALVSAYRRATSVHGPALGNILEDAGDAIVDVATSAIDAISDAGAEIGSVLKVVAPIVALVPGWGTALSVALSAAAAWASQDSLEDAVIDVVGAAMPGPASRAAFDSAADVTKTALEGGDVGASALAAGRRAAGQFGGKQGEAAYDVGVQVARGERVNDATWALARSQVSQQGPAALAAFDAGVAVKNGGDGLDATRAALRAYLETTGSAPALVAFDVGVAVAQGKSLQDAGYSALRNFVAGNTGLDRAVKFAEKLAAAAHDGKDLARVLEDELATDVGRYGVMRAATTLGALLPQWQPGWAEWGVSSLAARWDISDLMAQALQAVMRTGEPDWPLFARLTKTGVQNAIDKYGPAVVASRQTNRTYAETQADQREELLLEVARMPASSLSYATAKAEAAASILGRVRTPQGASSLPREPVVPDPEPLVQAPAPSRPRTGPVGNVVLGATVGLACLALVWWARSP